MSFFARFMNFAFGIINAFKGTNLRNLSNELDKDWQLTHHILRCEREGSFEVHKGGQTFFFALVILTRGERLVPCRSIPLLLLVSGG